MFLLTKPLLSVSITFIQENMSGPDPVWDFWATSINSPEGSPPPVWKEQRECDKTQLSEGGLELNVRLETPTNIFRWKRCRVTSTFVWGPPTLHRNEKNAPFHLTIHLHCLTIDCKPGYDKVSANGVTSEPQCNKKSDGSQDARRGIPNILN